MTKITDKSVREYFGHNGVECIVRISRGGKITRYGSTNVFDRSSDHWVDLGTREDAVREIANNRD